MQKYIILLAVVLCCTISISNVQGMDLIKFKINNLSIPSIDNNKCKEEKILALKVESYICDFIRRAESIRFINQIKNVNQEYVLVDDIVINDRYVKNISLVKMLIMSKMAVKGKYDWCKEKRRILNF